MGRADISLSTRCRVKYKRHMVEHHAIRHHRQVDVSERQVRATRPMSKPGDMLRPVISAEDSRRQAEEYAMMQTEKFWRQVWRDELEARR